MGGKKKRKFVLFFEIKRERGERNRRKSREEGRRRRAEKVVPFLLLFYLQIRATAVSPSLAKNGPQAQAVLFADPFRFTARYPLESKQSFLIDKIGGRLRV